MKKRHFWGAIGVVLSLLLLVGCRLFKDDETKTTVNQTTTDSITPHKPTAAFFEPGNGQIFWLCDDSAKYFTIYANDERLGELSSEFANKIDGYHSYKSESLMGYEGPITFKIECYNENYHINEDAKMSYAIFSFTMREGIDETSVTIDQDKREFVFSSDAELYYVLYNGKGHIVSDNSLEISSSDKKSEGIFVLPIYENEYAYGIDLTLERPSAPTQISYDASEGIISWDGVKGTQYELLIRDGDKINEFVSTDTKYSYAAQTNELLIEIRAVGENKLTLYSNYSSLLVEGNKFLDKIYIENNILKWQLIDGKMADFNISITNELDTIYSKKFGYSNQLYTLNLLRLAPEVGSYFLNIEILPFDSVIPTDSTTFEIYYPKTPSLTISYSPLSDIYDTRVSNIDEKISKLSIMYGYESLDNTVDVPTDSSEYRFSSLRYDEPGKYKFMLSYSYLDDDNIIYDKDSLQISYTREKLAPPQIDHISNYGIYAKIDEEGSSIGAYRYYYSFDGVSKGYATYYSNFISYPDEFLAGTDLDISFGIYRSARNSSEISSSLAIQKITRMPAPSIKALNNQIIISGQSGNDFVIVNTKNNNEIVTCQNNTWDIDISAGSHTMAAYTKGDLNNFVVDSAYSNTLELYKLNTPRVGVENGAIVLDSIDNATMLAKSYFEATINGEVVVVDGNSLSLMPYLSGTNSITISLKAKSNEENIISSDSSIEYEAISLISPTNPSVSNATGAIIWDDNENCLNGYSYDIDIYTGPFVEDYLSSTSLINSTTRLALEGCRYEILIKPNEYVSGNRIGIYLGQGVTFDFYKEEIFEVSINNNAYSFRLGRYETNTVNGYIGDKHILSTTSLSAFPDFSAIEAGVHQISFRLEDDIDYDALAIFKADDYIFTQTIMKLETPDGLTTSYDRGSFDYELNKWSANSTMIVSSKSLVPDKAMNYSFTIIGKGYEGGYTVVSTTSSYSFSVYAGAYRFRLSLVGECFSNDIYYKSSDTYIYNPSTGIFINPLVETVNVVNPGFSGQNYNFDLYTTLQDGYSKDNYGIYMYIYINGVAYNNGNPVQAYTRISLDASKGSVNLSDTITLKLYSVSSNSSNLASAFTIYSFKAV